tara:strand:- start:1304 stop:1918 length:615 start_codon:yes stop_codon:yes gene_type:complete
MNEDTMITGNNYSLSEVGIGDIRETHNKVSFLNTPKSFVKDRNGVDYVEYSYMREIADRYFPGWSWVILKAEALGSEAFMVHGRLTWYDGGIWRNGDATAAHDIAQKKDGSGFVNVGNSVKAANTDAIKKAFNMYLNIADDVYRNRVESTMLTSDDLRVINKAMEGLNEEWSAKISAIVDNGEVERSDIKKILNRIEIIKKENT